MKKIILLFISILTIVQFGFAQEDTTVVAEPVVEEAPAAPENNNVPVRDPWGSGLLLDQQTSLIPYTNTLETVIQHRFGSFDNGIKDVFGLYASANIRLGVNYVVYKNLQIGYGLTRKNMYSDFNIKYTIFEQTRDNSKPFALTLFGNCAIDSREKALIFTDSVETFGNSDRMSYFAQAIVGRKFNDWVSLQAAVSFSHFNRVNADRNHDVIGLHLNGKVKVTNTMNFVFNYDHPILNGIRTSRNTTNDPKPNLALGIEIITTAHAFQFFAGTANSLNPQDNMLYNQNDFMKNGMQFGFVITRLTNF